MMTMTTTRKSKCFFEKKKKILMPQNQVVGKKKKKKKMDSRGFDRREALSADPEDHQDQFFARNGTRPAARVIRNADDDDDDDDGKTGAEKESSGQPPNKGSAAASSSPASHSAAASTMPASTGVVKKDITERKIETNDASLFLPPSASAAGSSVLGFPKITKLKRAGGGGQEPRPPFARRLKNDGESDGASGTGGGGHAPGATAKAAASGSATAATAASTTQAASRGSGGGDTRGQPLALTTPMPGAQTALTSEMAEQNSARVLAMTDAEREEALRDLMSGLPADVREGFLARSKARLQAQYGTAAENSDDIDAAVDDSEVDPDDLVGVRRDDPAVRSAVIDPWSSAGHHGADRALRAIPADASEQQQQQQHQQQQLEPDLQQPGQTAPKRGTIFALDGTRLPASARGDATAVPDAAETAAAWPPMIPGVDPDRGATVEELVASLQTQVSSQRAAVLRTLANIIRRETAADPLSMGTGAVRDDVREEGTGGGAIPTAAAAAGVVTENIIVDGDGGGGGNSTQRSGGGGVTDDDAPATLRTLWRLRLPLALRVCLDDPSDTAVVCALECLAALVASDLDTDEDGESGYNGKGNGDGNSSGGGRSPTVECGPRAIVRAAGVSETRGYGASAGWTRAGPDIFPRGVFMSHSDAVGGDADNGGDGGDGGDGGEQPGSAPAAPVSDAELCRRDAIIGLVHTGILTRLRYLIEVKFLPLLEARKCRVTTCVQFPVVMFYLCCC
jgi:hypothetical protein